VEECKEHGLDTFFGLGSVSQEAEEVPFFFCFALAFAFPLALLFLACFFSTFTSCM